LEKERNMSVINTNITSLIAQKNLNASQSALTTAMERLSSGMRINSAKDDAAGQAIANRMSSQITGLGQAQRNANDGISVAQTAEGALNQINDNLQRIRELSVQAANGTNSEEDKASIQAEIQQRLGEINRISEQTDFNGTKVLSQDQTLSIQVGANDGEAISISLQQINAETLGLTGFNVDGSGEIANEAATADDLVLAGFSKAVTANANGSYTYTKDTVTANTQMNSADLMAQLDNGATVTVATSTSLTGYKSAAGVDLDFGDVGALTYSSTNDNFTYGATIDETSAASNIIPQAGTGPRAATITIDSIDTDVMIQEDGTLKNTNGEALYIDTTGNLTTSAVGTLGTDYAVANIADLTATMDGLTAGATYDGMALAQTDLSTATITLTDSGTTYTGTNGTGITASGIVVDKAAVASMLAADGGTVDLAADLTVTDDADANQAIDVFTVAAGGLVTAGETVGALTSGDAIYADTNGNLTEASTTTTTTTYYAQVDGKVTDDTGAQLFKEEDGDLTFSATTAGTATEDPLAALDAALKQVDSLRSDLGAIQNRFDSAISNLSTTTTNLSAARSRIEDADYAVEVANMTKAQILQQAGTSVLAQANQIPQGVLSLLG